MCVNEVNDEQVDPKFEYRNSRIIHESVRFYPDFKSCCDCDDGCVTNSCSCRRLTNEDFENDPVNFAELGSCFGYEYRHLPQLLLTGYANGGANSQLTTTLVASLYECNENEKCTANCANRVVQNGITAKLEVFHTGDRGWGVRCLHDLPKNTFVCLYSGQVLDSNTADRLGQERGDEYIADLNAIDVVEDKVGYEPECIDIEHNHDDQSDEESARHDQGQTQESLLSKRCASDTSVCTKRRRKNKQSWMRYLDFVGKEEKNAYYYSIDGKKYGNVGRFLNHSCDCNCILIPVYVDTHDPRLPWMAFFTLKHVPALTELTWDYLYQNGDDKKFECVCGAGNCRSKSAKGSDHD